MSSAPRYARPPHSVPPLVSGQRLKQPEFHRRYECYPDNVKFELVGGVVHMSSPLRWPHGLYDAKLGFVLELYALSTPGVESARNATAVLGRESEPQPDLTLRVLSEYGGLSWLNDKLYLEGSPEFLAEIAYSSRDIDLGGKREDYERAGVIEYLVVCIEEKELHWFHFPSRRRVRPDRVGIYRSRIFPGLWIDTLSCVGTVLLQSATSIGICTIAMSHWGTGYCSTIFLRLRTWRGNSAPTLGAIFSSP